MRCYLSLLFLFKLIAVANSQERYNYHSCVKYALEHNYQIQNRKLQIQKQSLIVKNARLNFIPSVNAFSSYRIKTGRTLDDATNNYVNRQLFSNDWSAAGNLVLFAGFTNINRVAFERYNELSVTEEGKQEQNQIAYDILEAYADFQLNKGLIEVQKQQYDLSKAELSRIEKMIELGRAAGAERYDISARLANDEYLLLSSQNTAMKAENRLRKLMNFPLDSVLELEQLQTSIEEKDYVAQAINPLVLPQIKALYYKLNAARRSLKIEKGELMPQLSFFSGWSSGFYQSVLDASGAVMKFPQQMNKNRSINYGISLSFPLTYGFVGRNNVKIAEIELRQAGNILADEVNKISFESRQAELDLEAAYKEYHAAQKKEDSETLAFEMGRKRRENGLLSLMEFYDLRNNVARAAIDILRTQMKVYIAQTILRYYKTGSMVSAN